MSDPTLVKKLAGHRLKVSDGIRHERKDTTDGKYERFFHGLMGWVPAKKADKKKIEKFSGQISELLKKLEPCTDNELVTAFDQYACLLRNNPNEDSHWVGIMCCIGLGAKRVLGLWPHPVQFMGAKILLSSSIVEMQTGEGKTLVAAMAATAAAGTGAMVHVLSTNDYLAGRDEEEMKPLFSYFCLDSGSVVSDMEPSDRATAYSKRICYVSAKELVFDYLKDQLAFGALSSSCGSFIDSFINMSDVDSDLKSQSTIPALHYCIVDEADSVLIDEARTPLIISRESEGIFEQEVLQWALHQAKELLIGVDFEIDFTQKQVELKDQALQQIGDPPSGVKKIWRSYAWKATLVRQALVALHLYRRDEQYIVVEDKIHIVDESTGRPMPDRSWEQGLHQMIEMKEDLTPTNGRETLTKITFQRFFRRYFLLSGLTGTASEVSRELWFVYGLRVCRIPPNKPNLRRQLPSICMNRYGKKWPEIGRDVERAIALGQPVLVGTRSVEASEQAAQVFDELGIAHVILNARQDASEADVVKSAGASAQVTIATNMAGRGTDIKLDMESRRAGGLHVILSEFHESGRIDRQLVGRSGRQGDPGTCRFIGSFEDEMIQNNAPYLGRIGRLATFGCFQRMIMRLCLIVAQRAAERRNYRSRMQTLKNDRELSKHIGFAGRVK